jgi:hypothetical protein
MQSLLFVSMDHYHGYALPLSRLAAVLPWIFSASSIYHGYALRISTASADLSVLCFAKRRFANVAGGA